MSLPNDPAILLSYVNTQLRDSYPSFDEMCKSLCADKASIVNKLAAIGYTYNPETNSFK